MRSPLVQVCPGGEDDGVELLALFVLNDKTNWAAWTPEGIYDATLGAFGDRLFYEDYKKTLACARGQIDEPLVASLSNTQVK
jgi:hypothetical protein